MLWLLAGLLLFLGLHSLRLFAPRWREARIATMGPLAWKGLYAVLSIAGFVLLVWGYVQARAQAGVWIWMPPVWLRPPAFLLLLVAFVCLVAAYVPRNHIKVRLGHPMTLGVALWALAHLLLNGSLRDMLLFGGFLLWSLLLYRNALHRAPPARSGGSWVATLLCTGIGFAAWAVFARYLHLYLIGVSPMG